MTHIWAAVTIVFSASACFWLGHYNEANKESNGWAWLWFICIMIADLKLFEVLP